MGRGLGLTKSRRRPHLAGKAWHGAELARPASDGRAAPPPPLPRWLCARGGTRVRCAGVGMWARDDRASACADLRVRMRAPPRLAPPRPEGAGGDGCGEIGRRSEQLLNDEYMHGEMAARLCVGRRPARAPIAPPIRISAGFGFRGRGADHRNGRARARISSHASEGWGSARAHRLCGCASNLFASRRMRLRCKVAVRWVCARAGGGDGGSAGQTARAGCERAIERAIERAKVACEQPRGGGGRGREQGWPMQGRGV